MKCPFCANDDTKVIDSRGQEDNSVIRRRRLCDKCSKRFTTYERIEIIPMNVVKNDGRREFFDRGKLMGGIVKSCNKRPITVQQIEEICDCVESAAMNNIDREISSKDIGIIVMEKLKIIDEVAYVRFASVYRQFKDINTFMEELGKMLSEKNIK